MNTRDAVFMAMALAEARYAYSLNEVPVGAIAVFDGQVVARAHNRVESLNDPLQHAEMRVLQQSAAILKQKWLCELEVYVTLEPCLLCAGAMILARIKRVVFGADEPRTGAFGSRLNVNELKLNHHLPFTAGVCKNECEDLMQRFFKEKRGK